MGMPVMSIREMRMVVPNRRVPVGMAVAGSGRNWRVVLVCVVVIAFTVGVLVRMLKHFVCMSMFVPLRQVQPYTDGHECPGCQQWRRHRLA